MNLDVSGAVSNAQHKLAMHQQARHVPRDNEARIAADANLLQPSDFANIMVCMFVCI